MRWIQLVEGQKAWTVAGWTPGLSRLVGAKHYPCGCLAGVYETRREELAEIVDAVGPDCRNSSHALNMVVRLGSPSSAAAAASTGWRSPDSVQRARE